MEFNEQSIREALKQFYSTSDETLRARLNDFLTAAQDRPETWTFAWSLLRTDSDQTAQYFGANCLYHKLSHGRLDEYLAQHRQRDDDDGSKAEILLRNYLVEQCGLAKTKLIRHKLTSVLAVYILHTVPDIWTNPFEELMNLWSASNQGLLLEIFGNAATEIRRTTMSIERKTHVRGVLAEKEALVVDFVANVLQAELRRDADVLDAAVRCVEAWIDFCGDAASWIKITALCMQSISDDVDGHATSVVSKFFCRFVENSDVQKLDTFVGQTFDFIFLLIDARRQHLSDDLVHMCVSLLENNARYILKNWTTRPSVQALSGVASELLKWPGYFPVDENYSGLTRNFWYNLFEEALAEEDSEIRRRSFDNLRSIYINLYESLMTKIRYPPDPIYADWSADDKEAFERYRTDMADCFACSYRIVSKPMTRHVAKEIFESEMRNGSWQGLEMVLFTLEAIGDYVSVDDDSVTYFFAHSFAEMPLSHPTLANTALRLVHTYGHIVGDDSRLLKPCIGVVTPFLNEPITVYRATVSLETLTRTRDKIFAADAQLIQHVVSAASKCFGDNRFKSSDQLRALSCIGYVLSVQSDETIVRYVDEFLSSRLDERLRRLLTPQPGQPPCTKEELLMEFDVMNCLINALGSRADTGNADNTGIRRPESNPIYVIIAQRFDLFSNLYTMSNGDADVATKICDTLRRALTALTDDAAPLVPRLCETIAAIFPPHACAIGLAKPVFLLFLENAEYAPYLTTIFNGFGERLSTDEHRTSETVDAYVGLCYQLIKKQGRFFASEHTNLHPPVIVACAALGRSNESPLVKQASLFLCELLKKNEVPRIADVVDKYGQALMAAAFERLKVELLTSCVEYVADVAFTLAHTYTNFADRWTAVASAQQNFLASAMLKEIGNKRKFRELAKKYNMECRKKIIAS